MTKRERDREAAVQDILKAALAMTPAKARKWALEMLILNDAGTPNRPPRVMVQWGCPIDDPLGVYVIYAYTNQDIDRLTQDEVARAELRDDLNTDCCLLGFASIDEYWATRYPKGTSLKGDARAMFERHARQMRASPN